MNNNHRITIFVAMITISFTAGAQEVYEDVDQQGVIEFSDQPSPGAREIDVRPNVVDVAPVRPVQSPPPAPSTGAPEAPAGSVPPEVIHEDADADVDYYGDYENRRNVIREDEERGREVVRPVRGETGREAVHEGGGRQ